MYALQNNLLNKEYLLIKHNMNIVETISQLIHLERVSQPIRGQTVFWPTITTCVEEGTRAVQQGPRLSLWGLTK